MLKKYIIGALIIVGLSFGWLFEVYQHQKTKTEFSDFKTSINEAGRKLAIAQRDQLIFQQSQVAKIDEQYSKDLLDANETIDDLLAGIRSGKHRVYVSASNCRKVPAEDAAASMDDGIALVRLGREDAEAIFSTAAYGDRTAIILSGLQTYVREVCLAVDEKEHE